MTAPPATEPDPATDLELESPVEPALEASGVRSARRHARAKGRRRRVGFVVAIVLLSAAIPVLGYVGVAAILSSRGGRLVDTTVAPDEPGYEAIVEPTPLALVVQTDAGRLVSLTVLSLADPQGGGAVLFVPPDTLTDPRTQAFGFDRLSGAFDVAGLDGVRTATANVLNASFTDAVEVDGPRLAALTAPVGPLLLNNPDDLDGETAEGDDVSFEAGPVELAPDQVGDYLAVLERGESDLNRLARHQLVWQAWIGAVAASPDPATAVPGEGGTGLGRYLAHLARGTVLYQTLPVHPAGEGQAESDGEGGEGGEDGEDGESGEGGAGFLPVEADIAPLVARFVPLPTASNPGSRIRVRLLDGAGSPETLRAIVEPLVAAGAQIVAIGNADRFTYAATEVRYESLTPRSSAEQMRTALGTGDVRSSAFGTDAFDVTIVVGTDLVQRVTEQGATTTD
jgi:hypothetical protein